MYEYKKVKWILTDSLEEMYWNGRRLAYYDKEVKISVWDKPIKKTVTRTKKEPQKIITTYFSENTVRWLCSFYKDLENQYFKWIENRAKNDKQNFVQFNESSEKMAWKKLWQFPKPIAERMLEVASAQAHGRIYNISEQEKEEIMKPLREEKLKEEIKREWFTTDQEKLQAEQKRQRIKEIIRQNPHLKEEARRYIQQNNPKVTWRHQEILIEARVAMIANNLLNKKS